ncbi:MAG: hypothetical protein SWK76_11290 [Actinomycetota bacterium]|nr:hypothetical protein [Actinomycetota bacterium]
MSGVTGKEEIVAKSLENLKKTLADLAKLSGEDEAAAFSEALFGEDSDFFDRLLELSPQIVNAWLLLSRGMAETLSGMDEGRRREVLASYLAGLDGERLAEAINSSCRAMIRINEENPEVFLEGRKDTYLSILDNLDSGLLRKGIVSYADSWTLLQEEVMNRMTSDAVLLANILGIIPPLINDILRLLSKAFSSLDLPSEILASAVFNVLSDIDSEQLGMVVNGLTGLVKSLHEGNLLLGRDEPRFRSVLSRFLEDLLIHVDKEQAALAVLAIAEDMETALGVIVDLVYREPDLLVLSTAALLSSVHTLLRGATDAVTRIAQLPESSLDIVVEELSDSLQPQVAVKLINSLLGLTERLLTAKPELPADFVGDFLSVLDTELSSRVFLLAIAPIAPVVIDELEITPRRVGATISAGLSAYNHAAAENPDAIAEAVSLAMDEIEPEELKRAVEHTLVSVTRAAVERPELLKALIRPAITAAWNIFKNYAFKLGGRLIGGSRGPR